VASNPINVATAQRALPVADGTRLQAVVDVFQRHLYMPGPAPLYVGLATVVANRLPGDPVWSMYVGPPGSGKTEVVMPLAGLPGVILTSELTVAGLLSGTSSKERDVNATGGLLPRIGDSGIILCKDFGTVLSMNREGRAALLAALREVFDGRYVRHLGTEGGKSFGWEGKVGLLAACTPAIDRHHAVMSLMGERFVLFRMPRLDEDEQMRRARRHSATGPEMRVELAAAVTQFMSELKLPTAPRDLSEAEEARLQALAAIAARGRSPVERNSYSREIEMVPEPEVPTRILITLDRLRHGLEAIGVPLPEMWRIVEKVAVDCMPAIRGALVEACAAEPQRVRSTQELALQVAHPDGTVRRHLQELHAHDVLDRAHGKTDQWMLSAWTRARLGVIRGAPVPASDGARGSETPAAGQPANGDGGALSRPRSNVPEMSAVSPAEDVPGVSDAALG